LNISEQMAFRLQAKQLWLTYPRCPIPKDEALAQLQYDLGLVVSKYIVAEELHADGASHIHAWLLLKEKCDIRDPNALDLNSYISEIGMEEGTHYHGHYQACRLKARCQKYCMKDGNYLTNLSAWELPTTSTAKKVWIAAIQRAKQGETSEAAAMIMHESPQQFIISNTSIMAYLQSLKETTYAAPMIPDMTRYKTKSFPTWDPLKTLILWGPSGIGKTSLAIHLLHGKGLLVSQIDSLRRFGPNYSGIILDDMSLMGDPITKKGQWPVEGQIHLVDNYNARQIRCRYENADIPARTLKIWTTNKRPCEILDVHEEAIQRRIEAWELKLTSKGKVKVVSFNRLF